MQGVKRFDARKAVEAALREAGLYRGGVDREMVLPVCRCVFAFSQQLFLNINNFGDCYVILIMLLCYCNHVSVFCIVTYVLASISIYIEMTF